MRSRELTLRPVPEKDCSRKFPRHRLEQLTPQERYHGGWSSFRRDFGRPHVGEVDGGASG